MKPADKCADKETIMLHISNDSCPHDQLFTVALADAMFRSIFGAKRIQSTVMQLPLVKTGYRN